MKNNSHLQPIDNGDGIANLQELNQSQYEAVTSTEGPVLVIAGAGSGKTRTLVYRVAHLVKTGVQPGSILLLTFTRKASREMLWRAGLLLNDSCKGVVGGTFHAIANMLLRRYGSYLGFSSSFTIIDRTDAEGIVNLLKSSLECGKKGERFPSKRMIVNLISGSVNKSIDLEDLIFDQYEHLSAHIGDILALQKHYQEFKFDHSLMDYDDLLVNWKRLLVEFPEIKQAISERFSHIMVDEYQDTNLIQADIIRLMAHTHDNVMVVGDDSQSIYSFRGADFHNIMYFPKIFADTKIIKLEENYRSTQPILSLTNDIIRNAVEKYTKTLFTRIKGGDRPGLFAGRSEGEEAAFVVEGIESFVANGVSLQDIAVLFRSGFHSYKLELELVNHGIEYEKRGGIKLTESAHIKDIVAFLRVLVNPQDTLSWNRMFLQLEKVGPVTAQKISGALVASEDPFLALADYPASKTWRDGFQKIVRLFAKLLSGNQKPSVLYEMIFDYYMPIFERIYSDDYPKRLKDLHQLRGIMDEYEELQSFIDDTSLDPPDEAANVDEDIERLILSTIHSSKGLEFKVVFVIGVADGRFPHSSVFFGEQWEEERRLLYVAATRAKKYLYFTYPRQIMTADRKFKMVGMSPYLVELQAGLLQRVVSFPFPGSGQVAERITDTPSSTLKKTHEKSVLSDFAVGCKVRHSFFGVGTVKKISKGGSLDIYFNRHGLKTLHLDYAKLTVL